MILLRCLSPPHRVVFQDPRGGMSNGQGKHNNPTTEMATTTSTEKRMHTARPRDKDGEWKCKRHSSGKSIDSTFFKPPAGGRKEEIFFRFHRQACKLLVYIVGAESCNCKPIR